MQCNALPISWWVYLDRWAYIFRLIIDLFTYEDFDFWLEWSFVFQYSIISAQGRNWWIFCCMLCYGIIYGCAPSTSTSTNTITYFRIIFDQMLGKEGKTVFDKTHYLSIGGIIRNNYHIHCMLYLTGGFKDLRKPKLAKNDNLCAQAAQYHVYLPC